MATPSRFRETNNKFKAETVLAKKSVGYFLVRAPVKE